MVLSMPVVIFISLLTLLGLVIGWCWYEYKNRKVLTFARKLPTVEPTLPFLGHLLYCLPDLNGVISNFALGLSLKAAEKNLAGFCFWAGPKPFIMIQNPDDIQILLNSTKSLEKGDEYELVKFALGESLFTAAVQLWKVLRRQLQPMFHPRNVELMVPTFNHLGVQLVKELSEHVGQGRLDLLPIISQYFLCSTGNFLFGKTTLVDFHPKSKIVDEIYKSISRSVELFSTRIVMVWLQWDFLFNWYYRKDLSQVKESQDFAQAIVEDYCAKAGLENNADSQSKDESSPYLITDAFTNLTRTSPDLFKEQNMCDLINNIFGAATETSSVMLSSCLLALACHQEFQDAVVQEIQSNIEASKSEITSADISRLTYMDQVLKETLRRFTLAPYISRKISEDTPTSMGVIPAGTNVYLDVFGNHMNPHVFSNPERFDPDRFLPENGQHRSKLAYLPFSGGPRNCIGKDYSMVSMKITLVHILRRFKVYTEENVINTKFYYHATMSRLGGYPVTLKERL